MTANQKAILDIVSNSQKHLTAEEIYLELRNRNIRISMATVYNNLKTLYEARRIQKVSIEGFPDRYDTIVRHDHLVCSKCGKLTDIVLEDLTDSLKAQTGLDFESYDLKINYSCDECKSTI